MTESKASVVWRLLRQSNFNASARFLEQGALAGEHVVEIEPGPSLSTDDITQLLLVAKDRDLELSYGKSQRRVLVLS